MAPGMGGMGAPLSACHVYHSTPVPCLASPMAAVGHSTYACRPTGCSFRACWLPVVGCSPPLRGYSPPSPLPPPPVCRHGRLLSIQRLSQAPRNAAAPSSRAGG